MLLSLSLNYNNTLRKLGDIQKDPNETTDLAEKYPEILKRLRKVLDEEMESCRQSYEGAEYGTVSRKRVHIDWIDIQK